MEQARGTKEYVSLNVMAAMETRVRIAPAVWDEMASEQTFFLF